MVSSELFSFLSNLFGFLHKNHKIFGGIPVLVVGDLLQLPPVNWEQVFYSPAWKLFFPLFLTKPQRQRGDPDFYNLLEELRFGNLSEKSKLMINEKVKCSRGSRAMINTTHVVGLRGISEQINSLINALIPLLRWRLTRGILKRSMATPATYISKIIQTSRTRSRFRKGRGSCS